MGEIRLTCPECGAEYRVDDGAIPAEGRDVECSSCGHGWRQPGLPDAAQPDGGAPRLNRPLPESVLSVLREEADLARRQRAGETTGPDVAPDAAGAILPGDPPLAGPAPSRHINTKPQRPAGDAPAQETLEATVTRTTPHGHNLTVAPLHEDGAEAGRAGYVRGFALSLALAAALLLAYVMAPDEGDQGQLAGFRMAVDEGRGWLHRQVFGTGE